LRRHRIHPAGKNRGRQKPRPNNEEGVIIILVAIFLLFVVGAMAALSIDITTFYTARSEAQLAADGAALAAARVLANSGMTSDPNAASDNLLTNAAALAKNVALQVAQQNQIGGGAATSITVSDPFNCGLAPSIQTNPCVKVTVTRSDLPTFFARIWGSKQITVSASATAEAYNPSGLAGTAASPAAPVAPTCVKPWLLPNQAATGGPTIFTLATGQAASGLLGTPVSPLIVDCGGNGDCNGSLQSAVLWRYYPGSSDSFPPPAASSVACSGTPYQLSIAGCVQTPIACNASVNLDLSDYPGRDSETFSAVNCLTHSTADAGDKIDQTTFPAGPFEFLTGADNPVVQAGAIKSGTDVLVSDSLVTVPVYGSITATNSANIVGFVQLFLDSNGTAAPNGGGGIDSVIVNLVGCSAGVTGTPVYGNGPSAVAVRLLTPP